MIRVNGTASVSIVGLKRFRYYKLSFYILREIEMTQPNVPPSLTQFHKRRLSNTLEVRSRYSTLDPDHFSEAVKLPALNSISKSVKYPSN
jgi:hypothetical protein